MKAIVIHEYGGPEVLRYEDVRRPEPKDDEVLIRVIAAGVNPVDAAVRHGMLSRRLGNDSFPLIMGYDVAGIVEKAGSKISKLKIGDAVYAYLPILHGAVLTRSTRSRKKPKLPRSPGLARSKRQLRYRSLQRQRGRLWSMKQN